MEGSKGTHDFDGSELETGTLSLHDKLSTQISLSSSSCVLMNVKGSATSPGPDKEVPSDILHFPLHSLEQDASKEEVIKWRLEKNGFPFALSDSELYDSSYDSSVSEQSSIISSPCMSFTLNSDTRSEDLEKADIWVSSLDLDEEDSALLPDKEQILDIFSSDFPSPSFRAITNLQFTPSSSSPGTSQKEEDNEPDDPIFWPFERISYNSPEFDKFLSVSPRRITLGIRSAGVRQLNPVLQRLQKNKLSSTIKSIEPNRSSINLGLKGTKASQDKIPKAATIPSRFSRTTKASASSKDQPVRNCEKKRPPHLKIGAPRKVTAPQLQTDQPLHQETKAGNIRKLEEKKSPIEELIGLDEFDGHEGISSDLANLANYQFGLWLSPR